jgi:hypothetical protein
MSRQVSRDHDAIHIHTRIFTPCFGSLLGLVVIGIVSKGAGFSHSKIQRGLPSLTWRPRVNPGNTTRRLNQRRVEIQARVNLEHDRIPCAFGP